MGAIDKLALGIITNVINDTSFKNFEELQDSIDTKVNISSYTSQEVLNKIKVVDGAQSGLDTDLVRGVAPTTFGLSLLSSSNADSAKTALELSLSQGATSAQNIAFTPVSNISAQNVQAAIAELDAEKLNISQPLFTIASAATTDLSTVSSIEGSITGTTTITSLGVAPAGTMRNVYFSEALTLTHNATSLILPTGANILTAANDRAEFISLGSGNWRCVAYIKAVVTAATTATAATVTFTPVSKISAQNVQAAIAELDAEKLSLSGGTIQANLSGSPQLTISDTSSGANSAAALSFSTGTTNSSVSLTLKDNTAAPFWQVKAGSGVASIFTDVNTHVFRNASGTNAFTITSTGDVTATGNVTGYSDERLKEDWSDLPSNFISKLADVKSGCYTRKDTGNRQTGVSAQSLQAVLPEAVNSNSDEFLTVAYGNAALVASVELAREILKLKKEIEMLKTGVAI